MHDEDLRGVPTYRTAERAAPQPGWGSTQYYNQAQLPVVRSKSFTDMYFGSKANGVPVLTMETPVDTLSPGRHQAVLYHRSLSL